MQLLVIFLFLYMVLTLFIGRQATYNDVLARKYADPSLIEGFEFENIQFMTTDKLNIRGWLIKSPNNPSNRVLIVLHGWQRTRTRQIQNIHLFLDQGFHILAYDQRAHGESDTSLITFGKKESLDLLAALNY